MRYVVVLNHSPEWFECSKKLLDLLFKNKKKIGVVWESQFAYELMGARARSHVPIDFELILPTYEYKRQRKYSVEPRKFELWKLNGELERWDLWGVSTPDLQYLEHWFSTMIEFLSDHLKQEKTIIFYEKHSTFLSFALDEISQSFPNVSHYAIAPGRIAKTSEFYWSFLNEVNFQEINHVLDKKEILSEKPDYLSNFEERETIINYFSLERLHRFFTGMRFKFSSFQLQNVPKAYLGFVKIRLKVSFYNLLSKVFEENKSFALSERKRVIIPLHFHPEASSSIYSWYIPNSSELIRIVRLALPSDIDLVVKPHPFAKFRDHYSKIKYELRHLPGLVFLPRSFDNQEQLFANCVAVLTTNSTFLLDATKRCIPVGLFAQFPYFNLEMGRELVLDASLPEQISNLISTPIHKDAYQEWRSRYVQKSLNQTIYEDLNDSILKHLEREE